MLAQRLVEVIRGLAGDFTGKTALHVAAERGHAGVVRTMLEGVGDDEAARQLARTPSSIGLTALHLAAIFGHADAVRALLEGVGDGEAARQLARVPSFGGFTALQLAANDSVCAALQEACA